MYLLRREFHEKQPCNIRSTMTLKDSLEKLRGNIPDPALFTTAKWEYLKFLGNE